jgi:hypothetical protein
MLEGIVELLVCLFLSALTLLIGSCIVGSIVAALRSVNRGNPVNTGIGTERRGGYANAKVI